MARPWLGFMELVPWLCKKWRESSAELNSEPQRDMKPLRNTYAITEEFEKPQTIPVSDSLCIFMKIILIKDWNSADFMP